MKIIEKQVTVFLDDAGRAAAELASLDTSYPIFVMETDDLGLWVRVQLNDGDHTVLVRWEYVLTMDLLTSPRKIGLES